MSLRISSRSFERLCLGVGSWALGVSEKLLMSVTETEITRILDELNRAHSGDAWYGTPVTQILAGVDHGQAAARPFEGVHTIWEIVLHMTAWKNEVRRRL